MTDRETDTFQRAFALYEHGELQAACNLCLTILKNDPRHAEALHLAGLTAYQAKQFQSAVDLIGRAIAINQDSAIFHSNLGSALSGLKCYEAALASYERAIAIKPDHVEAHFGKGHTLHELTRLEEALMGYDRAIELKPERVDAWNNRAIVQDALNLHEDALRSYDQVIALCPDYANAWYNRGNTLMDLRRLDEALTCYRRAADLGLDYGFLWVSIAQVRSYLCDWSSRSAGLDKLRSVIAAGEIILPFPLMALMDDPVLHRQAAELYAQNSLSTPNLPPIRACRGEKIHVAYLSADFHDHATAYLMVELFERHHRGRFELTAISFGPDKHDAMRQRVTAAFDRFVDVRMMSEMDVAKRCRELGVDIAIDLKGYTRDCRPRILAERCAPIQINYLGYPGTMGAAFMDYIVADHTLITPEDLPHYAEKVIWLPGSYQVNDRKRAIAEKTFTRAECGLPEQGFVFCCFNNNFKIAPATFDGWMRILHRVSGSVLWLLADNATAEKNLRQEAKSRGVHPDRLIFAKRLALAEHLARHRLADLFLDTLPYNAHTTASDALWAGLPVLTLKGRSFASRVAASLLNAVGLPQLITTSQEAYDELAVSLATDVKQLAAIKAHLQENRLTCALFDTERFARNLEQAYLQVMERYWAGFEPNHITIVSRSSLPPTSTSMTPSTGTEYHNVARTKVLLCGTNNRMDLEKQLDNYYKPSSARVLQNHLFVIIPSKTQEKQMEFLERSIRSVKNQSIATDFRSKIIVCVDKDAIVDRKIVERFGAATVQSEGSSQAAALNAAIRLVRHFEYGYVAFLEDDDEWMPDFLKCAAAAIEDYEFLSTTQLEVDETGDVLRVNDFPTPSGWFMPISTLHTVGEFNELQRFHIDNDWLGRLSDRKLKRVHLIEATAPKDSRLVKQVRPWLFNVLTNSNGTCKLLRHHLPLPLVKRLVHPRSSMFRISVDSALKEISIDETEELVRRFGRIPW